MSKLQAQPIAADRAPANVFDVCSPWNVLETVPSFPIMKKVGVD